jgi:hypothetical protein
MFWSTRKTQTFIQAETDRLSPNHQSKNCLKKTKTFFKHSETVAATQCDHG